jgi:hypothetical protein
LLALALEVAELEAEALALEDVDELADAEADVVAEAEAEAFTEAVDLAEGVPVDPKAWVNTKVSTAPTRTTPAIGP